MLSGRITDGPVPGAAPSAWTTTSSRLVRLAASFGVGLAALLLVATAFASSDSSWLLWVAAGMATGAVAGRLADLWVAPLVVVAFYPIAGWLGLVKNLGPFWLIGAAIGMALVTAGFAAGTMIRWRQRPDVAVRNSWRGRSRRWRALIVTVTLLFVAGLGGYTAYIGMIGSSEFTNPASGWSGCETPASRFGWAYESINYNQADDATLAANNPDMTNCKSQGLGAGDAVTASDGVHLAGWYIPAASGIGATGPTVVIVPGWKSNKSEVLRYAPSFHDRYNLVLADLRNQGRSSPAVVTMGLNEQRDMRAFVDWLVATKHPSSIAAMGNSMGAATVLAEARTDPRIEALILDSAHANLDMTIGNILETEHGQPSVPGAAAIVVATDLRVGGDVRSIDPVRTITKLGDRPVLMIHSTTDKVDPPAEAAEVNFDAARNAGVAVELHYCPGLTTGNGSHGTVVERCPADWSRWANQFLDAAFAN
jgi:fermentation-respiration switch protein FrsA (DUF1100 family)